MNISEEQEREIIRIYTKEKRGQIYCAKKVLGVKNPKYVKEILYKHNIHIRSQKESAIASNKNRIKYISKDLSYFEKQNENMAWILGILASDGTIAKKTNRIKITLAIKDIDVLQKIKKAINLDEPIKTFTTNAGYDCCSLSWTCEEHKKQLAKYSIIPTKTFCLKPPVALDKKYWVDYIRGYFDGDGSVNLIKSNGKKKNTSLRWQICSATEEILTFVVDYLYDAYQIPKVNIQKRKDGLYYFQYSTIATRKIYDILYYNPNLLYMERKKNHYENILK